MALPERNPFESVSNLPFTQHFSTPLSTGQCSATIDDSEEWEYEYSSTETETFYLTLDLTTPLIPCARPQAARAGRSGYRSIWINAGLRRQNRQLDMTPAGSIPKTGIRASKSKSTLTATPTPVPAHVSDPVTPTNEGNEEGDTTDEEEEEAGEQQELLQNRAKAAERSAEVINSVARKSERIQILDLHTENPIISFKAHTFSCSWAENIGTELLFTFNDPDRPLPAIRSLADDVELLAASSARLLSKVVKLEPKASVQDDLDSNCAGYRGGSPGFPDSTGSGITIPVGNGASGSRKAQARFLERMMEIKQQKGEKDSVTVVAQRRLYPGGWKNVLKEKRAEERAELLSTIRTGGNDVQEAVNRLKVVDGEDGAVEEEDRLRKENGSVKKSSAGRKPKNVDGSRPSKRARGGPLFRKPRGGRARLNLFHDAEPNSPNMVEESGDDPDTLSTPTPQHWDDPREYPPFPGRNVAGT